MLFPNPRVFSRLKNSCEGVERGIEVGIVFVYMLPSGVSIGRMYAYDLAGLC